MSPRLPRRRTAALIGAGLALTLVAACSNGPGASDPTGSTNGDTESATVTLAIVAAGETPTAYQDEVARFNDSHPGITLELQTYPSGDAYNQALLGQVAGGAAPDIFLLDEGTQMQQFVDAQAIIPVTDLAEEAGVDLSAFDQNLVGAATIDGTLYAVPKDYSTTVLTYSKSAFADAGLQPPTTWDELRTAAKALTADGRYGLGMYPQINYLLAWIGAFGGSFVSADGISNFDNPDHVRAVDTFLSMFNQDKSIASPQMTGASWDGEMLAKGQVAMVFGGSWVSGGVPADQASDIGVVALPADKQAGSVLYATGWVISSASKNPSAAATVISFLTSDDELVTAHDAGIILLPPKASALATLAADNDDPLLKIAQVSAVNGVPFGGLSAEQVDAYNAMLSELTSNGSTSSQDAITALAKTIG